MIQELIPPGMASELVRLGSGWCRTERDGTGYRLTPTRASWLFGSCKGSLDFAVMRALGEWLLQGPKVFRPTASQQRDLAEVEARVSVPDYVQPYPALLVEFAEGIGPFCGALAYKGPDIVTLYLRSRDLRNDVCVIIGDVNSSVEESISKYQADCAHMHEHCRRASRVAVNACLLLVYFGHANALVHPGEAERDRRLAARGGEAGARAEARLQQMVECVSFQQEVCLHAAEPRGKSAATDREMPPHHRRGHVAMVACGEGRQERRLVYRRPCFVRADKFVGNLHDTGVNYR